MKTKIEQKEIRIKEEYGGCRTLKAFLKKFKVKTMESAFDGHKIVNNFNERLLKFLIDFEIEFWIDANDNRTIHFEEVKK